MFNQEGMGEENLTTKKLGKEQKHSEQNPFFFLTSNQDVPSQHKKWFTFLLLLDWNIRVFFFQAASVYCLRGCWTIILGAWPEWLCSA